MICSQFCLLEPRSFKEAKGASHLVLCLDIYVSTVLGAVESAWQRTVHILFRRFNVRKWLVLGFAAWLSGFGSGKAVSSFNLPFPGRLRGEITSPRHAASDLLPVLEWLKHNVMTAAMLGGLALLVGIAVWLIALWLGSRGKFVFLAGVARNRAAMTAPWQEFAALADSLFLWRLCYDIVLLVVVGTAVGLGVVCSLMAMHDTALFALTLTATALLLASLFIVAALVSTFLEDFVVPLMYRYRMNAMQSWGYFLQLLRQHFHR